MVLGVKPCLFRRSCFTLMVSIFTLGSVFTGAQPIGPHDPCPFDTEDEGHPGGMPCPPGGGGGDDPCDVPWSVWGPCNNQCIQFRIRATTIPCSDSLESRPCSPSMCCEPYQMTPWSAWGSCSVNCGTGTKTRSRDVTTAGTCVPSPATTQSVSCSGNNCEVSSWSTWGTCSKTCGIGQKTRVRHIIQTNGCSCPSVVETRNCNTQCCGYCQTCSGWPLKICHAKCCQ